MGPIRAWLFDRFDDAMQPVTAEQAQRHALAQIRRRLTVVALLLAVIAWELWK